ncbi:MAG: HAD family hydrolase [bacterium]
MMIKVPFPKVLLFDVGGVLIHPDGFKIAKVIYERTGIYVDANIASKALFLTAYEAANSSDPENYWKSYMVKKMYVEKLSVNVKYAEQVWLAIKYIDTIENSLWTICEQDTSDILKDLKQQGLILAIVSNTNGRLRADLEKFSLLEYFTAIVDSEVDGVRKPDPEAFKLALKRIGQINPALCWHIGDDPYYDVWASSNAGIGCSVYYNRFNLQAPTEAGLVINTLSQLKNIIHSLKGMNTNEKVRLV